MDDKNNNKHSNNDLKSSKNFDVFLTIILVAVVCTFIWIGISNSLKPAINNTISPIIVKYNKSEVAESFLKKHPSMGEFAVALDLPDWDRGIRQKIVTTTGDYMFYLENNEVITVKILNSKGQPIKEIYRK